MSKKERSLSLFDEGLKDVEAIAAAIDSNPTYVASALMQAGRSVDYADLYTPSRPKNRYGENFNGVLRFKDEEAARESVRQLDVRYQFYLEIGDRQGQYQARSLGLIGYERAMGLGKVKEARLFADWLRQTLDRELAARLSDAPADARTP
jgi:hypothetical protein